MKKILLTLAIVVIAFNSFAQSQVVITDEMDFNVMEKLIQMAKDYYPQRKIVGEREQKAKNDVRIANLSYLDMFHAHYYWRPNDRRALDELNPYVTNGFQVGISFNPGSLFSKPFRVKNATADHKIAKLEQQAYDAQLESEVKARYYNYVLQLRNFKQKALDTQTAKGEFLQVTESFRIGEISLNEYNKARSELAVLEQSKLQSEVSFLRARDDLEELIGTKISQTKEG